MRPLGLAAGILLVDLGAAATSAAAGRRSTSRQVPCCNTHRNGPASSPTSAELEFPYME